MTASPAVAPVIIEATTIRKVRARIIPFVFILFMIAFVDRINVGFAALTMNRELAISSEAFGLVAGIFFIGYFVFEIPSNLLMQRIGARIWIARILVSWGIVAVLTGFARTATHLYVLRLLLGVAEAGYIPGILLYLTYWFNQRRLAHAIALFCAANPVASVVGAPISGVILDRIHWFGFSSWRWLLILEGIPAILGGILSYFLLPDRPATAKFLAPEEKEWLIGELKLEQERKVSESQINVGRTLVHGRVWHLSIAYFLALVGMYAMNFWMPQFVKVFSTQRSNATVGLFVMIPYLVAVPAMVLVSKSSDTRRERRYHIAIPEMVGAIALLLLGAITPHSAFLSVALWCCVASGIYCLLGPFWSLPNEFLTGFSAAAGIALINSFGNLGGFVGPYAMGAINKWTGSFRGGFAFAGIALFTSAMMILALRKRSAQETSAVPMAQSSPAVIPTDGIDL